jgi:hypothetical protein
MLVPQLYYCPEKLKGILHYDENENYYFVFGDKCISLALVKILAENFKSPVDARLTNNQIT